MEHYVTYYYKPTIKEEQKSISNPELFLLSQGKKGLKNLSILDNTDRVTRKSEQTDSSLSSSTYLQKIEKYRGAMQVVIDNINFFLQNNIKEECYSRFSIPKSTGGLRWIDAPNEDLMELQRQVARLLDYMGLIPHNNAHAYIAKRSIATNANYHKDSNHFVKVDLTKFFPSITDSVLKHILPKIGILAYVNYSRDPEIQSLFQRFLEAVIDIATLKGSLPQGTPLSPLLSNLVMIPFDYEINAELREWPKQILVTRYADDLVLSSFYAFADRKEEAKIQVEGVINEVLRRVFGPGVMQINQKKTRVSTKYGKNRITGIKVNGENNVTIGYKEKQLLKKNLAKLIIMKKSNELDYNMAQEVIGYFNFLNAIEPDYARYVRQTLERKFNIPTKLQKWLYN